MHYFGFLLTELMYFSGPIIFGDFVNLKMEAARGQIFKGMGAESGTLPPVR